VGAGVGAGAGVGVGVGVGVVRRRRRSASLIVLLPSLLALTVSSPDESWPPPQPGSTVLEAATATKAQR
jgi:hypothetical protein